MRRAVPFVLAVALLLPACSSSDGQAGSSPTTTAARRTDRSTDPVGRRFDDPQGGYQLVVADSWRRLRGNFVAEVEGWQVGARRDGFAPNVNVLLQEYRGTPQGYLELSQQGGGAEFDEAEVVTLDDGHRAARMVYSVNQGRELRCLGVAVMGDGVAVLATLTALPEDFDRLLPEVEPYLRTLSPADLAN